jgi:hypothetical protein
VRQLESDEVRAEASPGKKRLITGSDPATWKSARDLPWEVITESVRVVRREPGAEPYRVRGGGPMGSGLPGVRLKRFMGLMT